MDKTNFKYANQFLLEDPETGEELRPFSAPQTDDQGSICLKVENKDGSRKWMHTIKTEEI